MVDSSPPPRARHPEREIDSERAGEGGANGDDANARAGIASTIGDARFVIVTGKGGVGKTTVCAALARKLSSEGKRVLVCLCNTKERLSTMMGSEPVEAQIAKIAPNLWAVNMDPEQALSEYGSLVLRSKGLSALLFDNKVVRAFFRAVPGMQEWAMLGKAWWHTTEQDATGASRFDVVILDAPATGHGLDMLRVPKVIVDVVPPGVLRRDAERAWTMFHDPAACAVVLVTLPEEMPTTETLELAQALREQLHFAIRTVVVNSALPPLFSPREREALLAVDGLCNMQESANAANASVSAPSRNIVAAARQRAQREQMQSASVARLANGLGITPVVLPLLFDNAAQPHAIEQLARCI